MENIYITFINQIYVLIFFKLNTMRYVELLNIIEVYMQIKILREGIYFKKRIKTKKFNKMQNIILGIF